MKLISLVVLIIHFFELVYLFFFKKKSLKLEKINLEQSYSLEAFDESGLVFMR